MTPGAHDRFPAVLGEMQAPTEYLMNIADLEGNVLKLRVPITCCQQSYVMMVAFLGAAAK